MDKCHGSGSCHLRRHGGKPLQRIREMHVAFDSKPESQPNDRHSRMLAFSCPRTSLELWKTKGRLDPAAAWLTQQHTGGTNPLAQAATSDMRGAGRAMSQAPALAVVSVVGGRITDHRSILI